MKYLERLTQKQENTIITKKNKYLVKKNSIQFKADALAIEQAIDVKKLLLENLLAEDTLSSVDILNAQDALDAAIKDSKALKILEKELFD